MIRTCLWFREGGEAAVDFYTSLIPDSRIEQVFRPGRDGPVIFINFTLAGVPYAALNGGATVDHNTAASIVVETPDQAETDRIWQAILDTGGSEIRCGWITDGWGVTWQVVPQVTKELLFCDDPAASQRVYEAIHTMVCIAIAGLRAAHAGKEVA